MDMATKEKAVEKKVNVLEEVDRLVANAQKALKGFMSLDQETEKNINRRERNGRKGKQQILPIFLNVVAS